MGVKEIKDFNIKSDNYDYCPPKADAMIHSLRAFGYDLGMAIADLIDNSIYAEASNVWVQYDWNEGDPWIRIIDDGKGMSEDNLVMAMTLGSKSPLESRDSRDLGRFGLGLKTASFSQCKLITVASKTIFGTGVSIRFWDLDYIEIVKEWKLGKQPDEKVTTLLDPLKKMQKGTIVVWKKLDRIVDESDGAGHDPKEAFLIRFLYVKKYLEMVFHRYLENSKRKLNIYIGAAECKPWDPYLLKNNFKQPFSAEKYEDSKITVTPYVLPHVSNRSTEENEEGAGPKGWNAQQGFYVYRNKRMIVSGGYLDFDLKPEEHFKLARIKIDITNDMDHEWSIDVRKAVASPPDRLKKELLRIAKATRRKASEVYRARTGGGTSRRSIANKDNVWLKRMSGEKIIYKLNLNHPILRMLLDEVSPEKKWINNLCYLIESTVPHRLIIMDGLEHEDCHVDLPDDLIPPPPGLIDMCRELYDSKISKGCTHEEAVDIVCCIEPFNSNPIYRAVLDSIIEGS